MGKHLIPVLVADTWYPDEINQGHLDWFFYLLAGVLMFNLLFIFIPVSYYYRYVPHVGGFSKQKQQPRLSMREEHIDPPLISQQAQANIHYYNDHGGDDQAKL